MSGADSTEEMRNMAGENGKKRGCCRRHPVACGVTLLVVGFVSLAVVGAAIGLRPFLNKTFMDTVDKGVELLPGTEGTTEFKNSSSPLYTKFYFFNVTNPKDVTSSGAHPILAQCGPYTYRELRIKQNLDWIDNDTVVDYDLNITYIFEPSMSVGDPLEDTIITLNIPLYVLFLKLEALEKTGSTVDKVIDFIVEKFEDLARDVTGEHGLFMTIKVDALLFGYNDTLLSDLKRLLIDSFFFRKYAYLINPEFGLENRTEVQTDNEVYTGKSDISQVGEFLEWNGNFEIYEHGGWGTSTAKMINGTGGFLFAPNVMRQGNLTAFITELYRSGYFTYTEDLKLHGITVYRFVLPKEELVSSNQDRGFYPYGPDGVLNLTAVFEENAPVFASKPHFLDADPGYRENVTGLKPNRALHDSYLDVEPITGHVLRAAKRIQINLRLHRYHYFDELKKIMPELMMPVFWASEEGTLTKSDANKFKLEVYGAKYGIEAAVWGAVGIGGLVFLTMSLCFVGIVTQQGCNRRRRLRPRDPDEHTSLLN
jgi:lysosome membrane protein 2